jgi:hypothetical protein
MRKLKNIIIFSACFMCSHAFAWQSEGDIFEQINNSYAIYLSGLNVNYKESSDTSNFKSTEAGTILGSNFDMRHTFLKKIYTDLYLDIYNGELEYDGALLDPPHTPLKIKLRHLFFNTNAKVGYVFAADDSPSLQFIPYLGVGYRYWDRQYNNIVEEKYQHGKTIVGLKLDWLLTDDFILSPYIEGGTTFCAYMQSDYIGLSYKLGSKPIYSVGLELNYKIAHKIFLSGFVDFTSFKYGISDKKFSVKRNGIFWEPNSKTNEVKIGLGVRFS